MKKDTLAALRAAFPHTIPIMTGFLFLGMTYGIYMNVSGFSFVYPMLMSMTIFAGSMEFVTVNLLLGAFDPFRAFAMTIMVNARHLFYGLSLLDKYRDAGFLKPYLIFGLCDESFSINCSVDVPQNVDRSKFYFFVTLLNQLYWITGSTLGGIFGSFISFDTKGIDFVMTAMFVVIFLEQWLKEKTHISSVLGMGISALSLLIFGAEDFIIPAMAGLLGALTLIRKPLSEKLD